MSGYIFVISYLSLAPWVINCLQSWYFVTRLRVQSYIFWHMTSLSRGVTSRKSSKSTSAVNNLSMVWWKTGTILTPVKLSPSYETGMFTLTHCDLGILRHRVSYIFVKIGSNYGLLPDLHKAITWIKTILLDWLMAVSWKKNVFWYSICEMVLIALTLLGLGPFLSLAPSKLRLCSANHWPGYWSNLPCDWLSTAWAYSEQQTDNGPWMTPCDVRGHCQ